MKKVLVLLAAFGFVGYASADILWDQQPNVGNNFVDQDFDDYPQYSSYMVVDVNTGPGWNVDKVTTYYTYGNGSWNSNMTGVLNVFAKTGNLPGAGDDPTLGMNVPVDVTVDYVNGVTKVSTEAAWAGTTIPAGDYWIGLTPKGAFGTYLQEFHLDSTLIGAGTAWRNPGGSFGYGTAWITLPVSGYSYQDAAITVEGTLVPEPASVLLLGLAGLLIRRR